MFVQKITSMNKIAGFFLKKYIKSPKKEWKRFDSVFMVVGIVISVAILTTAIAVFEGYETVLKEKILGVNSHIYIFKPGAGNLQKHETDALGTFFDKQKEVASYSPVIVTPAMSTTNGKINGCILRGIDWQNENLPTEYKSYVLSGTYKLDSENDVVIGHRLAKEQNLAIGDSIKLINPANSGVSLTGLYSARKYFTIVGLFTSGMFEYDSKYVFMNYSAASEFCSNQEEFSMMEVKLKTEFLESADYLSYKWNHELNNEYQLSSWIDFNGSLFSLLELEKWVIFIILCFLILTASFNVVSAVSASIRDKRRDLGILKAMGASNMLLKKIFIGKTLIIAFFGIISGQVIGILLAVFFSKQTFFLLKGEVYFLDTINVKFDGFSSSVIFVTSLLIVFTASFFPLKNITDLNITDVLRTKNE
jgi:lipoprotein-releasing system permease protein